MSRTDNTVMVATTASVDEFIDKAEPAGRRADALALRAMLDRVTGTDAVMWGPSIVGYGSYHYRYATGREGDSPILGFSPRKASMSLYGIQYEGSQGLLKRLGNHKRGAGCVWVGRFDKLDLDVLEQLFTEAWKRGAPTN